MTRVAAWGLVRVEPFGWQPVREAVVHDGLPAAGVEGVAVVEAAVVEAAID